MVVFEIFRGSWAGCAFWRQCTEATTSFLSLMSTTRYWAKSSNASVSLEGFEPAETPVQEILDELKQSKWLNNLCPKSCEGKWCISEDSQQWWQPFFPERLAERSALLCCGHGKRRYSVRSASGSLDGGTLSGLSQTLGPFSSRSRAVAQAGAAGALSMNIVGQMHELLCDDDGLARVGVNTHFTAVRFKTLQVDSPEVQEEDDLLLGTRNSFSRTVAQYISLPFCSTARPVEPGRSLHRNTCLGERS